MLFLNIYYRCDRMLHKFVFDYVKEYKAIDSKGKTNFGQRLAILCLKYNQIFIAQTVHKKMKYV